MSWVGLQRLQVLQREFTDCITSVKQVLFDDNMATLPVSDSLD